VQDKVETLIGQIQAGQEQLAALQEQINQMHQMVNTEGA
jgi:chaperonin cofactor prefoldin